MQTEEYSIFFRPPKVGCLWRPHKSVSLFFFVIVYFCRTYCRTYWSLYAAVLYVSLSEWLTIACYFRFTMFNISKCAEVHLYSCSFIYDWSLDNKLLRSILHFPNRLPNRGPRCCVVHIGHVSWNNRKVFNGFYISSYWIHIHVIWEYITWILKKKVEVSTEILVQIARLS